MPQLMIRPLLTLAVVALALGAATAQDDPKAVIEKAIKAHGGEEKLAKLKATQMKAKGTIDIMGVNVEFTAEASTQLPAQFRNELKLEVMGQAVTVLQVLNGDKGWVSAQGMTMEVMDKQLDEMKDQVYATYLESFVPLLKDKQFKLEALKEEQVDGKPAVGVKVSAKGHKDVSMYFDKASFLLVKSKKRGLDPTGAEVDSESLYSEFKEIQGLKQPMKVVVKNDGKRFMEAEMTEVKYLEKLDDALFAKP